MESKIENITLVGVRAKPYDFEGKKGEQVKGVSYRATLAGEDDIFIVKTDEEVHKDIGDKRNVVGTAIVDIKRDTVTGVINLYLKRFDYNE
jgi:hypothetical protein